jgi:hypothetical protein
MATAVFAMPDWSETRDVTYARLPIGWPQSACRFRDPLDFLGEDGGGAVGTGPATVGAALAPGQRPHRRGRHRRWLAVRTRSKL